MSLPRTLSANIPESQKGVYIFYNLPINFHLEGPRLRPDQHLRS